MRDSTLSLDFSSIALNGPDHSVDKWSHNFCLRLDRSDLKNATLFEYNDSGKLVRTLSLNIPDAESVFVQDFDLAIDGSIVTVGFAESRGKRVPFLAQTSSDGSKISVTRTTPFVPRLVAAAPDGTIWTVGTEVEYDSSGTAIRSNRKADVLRQFGSDGKLKRSGFPRNTIDPNRALSGSLVVSESKIGWFSPASGSASYVEASLDLSIISTFTSIPADGANVPILDGLALTEGDKVYASVFFTGATRGHAAVYTLDRNTKAWDPVTFPSSIRPTLLGHQDEMLAFHELGPDFSKLSFYKVLSTDNGPVEWTPGLRQAVKTRLTVR